MTAMQIVTVKLQQKASQSVEVEVEVEGEREAGPHEVPACSFEVHHAHQPVSGYLGPFLLSA